MKFYKSKSILFYIAMILIILLFIYFFLIHSNTFSIDSLPPPSQIPIYYINLENSKNRHLKMQEQCSKLNCHRIDAINGKKLDRIKYSHLIKSPKMKDTTIACFLSHIKALQTFLQTQQPIALILEDDVNISSLYIEKMNQIYSELKEKKMDFDIIFLGGTRICGSSFSRSLLKAEQIHGNCNAGAFAYLISQRGANRILQDFHQKGILKMYDHQIRDSFSKMKVFYANPPLVTHDFDIPSDRLEGTYTQKYIQQSQEILIK